MGLCSVYVRSIQTVETQSELLMFSCQAISNDYQSTMLLGTIHDNSLHQFSILLLCVIFFP